MECNGLNIKGRVGQCPLHRDLVCLPEVDGKKLNIDEKAWYNAYLDTPMGLPKGLTEDQAFMTPGCCVKTRETSGHWPVMTGKLVDLNMERDRVLVRGHGDVVSPRFVWEGTVRDYRRVWRCD